MAESVSVVIANYNMAKFVEQAIRSVLEQTQSPLEVIVVDDGSTDQSREVIRRVAVDDSRVVVIEQCNAGQTRAKNAGVAAARGTVIGFCDADDYWAPSKLELQLPLFERPEIGLVFGRARRVDLSGATLAVVPQRYWTGRVLDALIVENFIPFGTALVRSKAFRDAGGFDERYRMGIDWEAWLRLARLHEFAFLDAVVYTYRVWEGQMSTNTGGRFDAALRIMEDFERRFPGAVARSALKLGFASTFANRAHWQAVGKGFSAAVAADLWRAIQAAPLNLLPWKVTAKCILRRA
jgi:glycosyltransferase involved in cell wall biosynthesis